MKHKLVIDADPGIVDALALIVAMLDPEIDLLAITGSPGVVSGMQANHNIQTIVSRLDPVKYPRIGSCESQLKPSIPTLRDIATPLLNGETGLGDCPTTAVSLASPHASAKVLVDVVRGNPREVTLLTLGPLTNITLACELHPTFLSELKSLVCLAGSIVKGGDVTASAEGNVYADPESARTIFTSSIHKTLIPLDVASQLVLTFSDMNRLPHDPHSRITEMIDQLLPFALRSARRHLGQEGIELREVAALAAITRPQLFSRKVMAVDVETQGELTRGMTVFDRRGHRNWLGNIDVVHEIDADKVLDYFTGVLWNALENQS
ncbi:MAG: nucleoside hydrolase [Planctomycetaceae bacterium]|nr:nucleoside hydrolase [Planctomycetaceae bacterium]